MLSSVTAAQSDDDLDPPQSSNLKTGDAAKPAGQPMKSDDESETGASSSHSNNKPGTFPPSGTLNGSGDNGTSSSGSSNMNSRTKSESSPSGGDSAPNDSDDDLIQPPKKSNQKPSNADPSSAPDPSKKPSQKSSSDESPTEPVNMDNINNLPPKQKSGSTPGGLTSDKIQGLPSKNAPSQSPMGQAPGIPDGNPQIQLKARS